MFRLRSLAVSLTVSILSLYGCKENENKKISGEVQFGFEKIENLSGRVSSGTPVKLLITIENSSETVVMDRIELGLVAFGEEFLTDPISFDPGTYSITEYLVLNASGETIYATPLEGSDLAHLVENPLPVSFEISSDVTNKVGIEVVSTDAGSGEDFGYATFTFDVVEFVQFQLATFVFDPTTTNFELTSASYSISSDGVELLAGELDSATNTVTLPVHTDYSITIEKSGYNSFTSEYTKTQLEDYTNDPLEVKLLGTDMGSILIETDSSTGKDALLSSLEPDNNFGDYQAFYALAWTWSDLGGAGVQKSIIEFDMSSVPVGKTIVKATLKLKFMQNSYFADLYHQFKSNEALLQRVTEAWDESIVTWNNVPAVTTDNQVNLPSTISNPYQDYNIDVTQLVIDQQTEHNYGFLLSLVSTDHYRGVVMASSDHLDDTLHPELEIIYEQ